MSDPGSDHKAVRTAMLFDLRTVIGGLFTVYGVVCVIWGVAFDSADELSRSGGINVNLWAGLGMLITAAGFLLWVWLNPPPTEESD